MELPAGPRFELPLTPPYDWPALRSFLAARAIHGAEVIDDGRYVRTLRVDGRTGWLAVGPGASAEVLSMELSPSLATAAPAIVERARHAFDLDADPGAIARALGPLAAPSPGLRVPHAFDPFETTVRAVLGQQISVKGASTLAGRFVAAFGEPVATPHDTLTHLPPTAPQVAALSADAIAGIGMPGSRAATILGLAAAKAERRLVLYPRSDHAEATARLLALPGIGPWTAEYVAMRVLGSADAFPASDLGVRMALGGISAREAEARAEAWRPYRSYAVMHLWRSLGGPSESPVGG